MGMKRICKDGGAQMSRKEKMPSKKNFNFSLYKRKKNNVKLRVFGWIVETQGGFHLSEQKTESR
jgi:hypothetical protein